MKNTEIGKETTHTYVSGNDTTHFYSVTKVESGQPKPYADSRYVYIVTSNRPKKEVELFCKTIVHKSYNTSELSMSMDDHFKPKFRGLTEVITEDDVTSWKYTVTEAFTD